VQTACETEDQPSGAEIRDWVAATLARAGVEAPAGVELGLRIVGEDEGRALNERYRGRNTPTNVLSFPAGDGLEPPAGEPRPLGDLVVCAPVVLREAREQGKTAAQHWAHLVVHGTLHLLGYDHENEAGAAEMEGLEIAILADRGLPDPYAVNESD